jgi:hypothetical protein
MSCKIYRDMQCFIKVRERSHALVDNGNSSTETKDSGVMPVMEGVRLKTISVNHHDQDQTPEKSTSSVRGEDINDQGLSANERASDSFYDSDDVFSLEDTDNQTHSLYADALEQSTPVLLNQSDIATIFDGPKELLSSSHHHHEKLVNDPHEQRNTNLHSPTTFNSSSESFLTVYINEFNFHPKLVQCTIRDNIRFALNENEVSNCILTCEGQFERIILNDEQPFFIYCFPEEGEYKVYNEIYNFVDCKIVVLDEVPKANKQQTPPKLFGSFNVVPPKPVFNLASAEKAAAHEPYVSHSNNKVSPSTMRSLLSAQDTAVDPYQQYQDQHEALIRNTLFQYNNNNNDMDPDLPPHMPPPPPPPHNPPRVPSPPSYEEMMNEENDIDFADVIDDLKTIDRDENDENEGGEGDDEKSKEARDGREGDGEEDDGDEGNDKDGDSSKALSRKEKKKKRRKEKLKEKRKTLKENELLLVSLPTSEDHTKNSPSTFDSKESEKSNESSVERFFGNENNGRPEKNPVKGEAGKPDKKKKVKTTETTTDEKKSPLKDGYLIASADFSADFEELTDEELNPAKALSKNDKKKRTTKIDTSPEKKKADIVPQEETKTDVSTTLSPIKPREEKLINISPSEKKKAADDTIYDENISLETEEDKDMNYSKEEEEEEEDHNQGESDDEEVEEEGEEEHELPITSTTTARRESIDSIGSGTGGGGKRTNTLLSVLGLKTKSEEELHAVTAAVAAAALPPPGLLPVHSSPHKNNPKQQPQQVGTPPVGKGKADRNRTVSFDSSIAETAAEEEDPYEIKQEVLDFFMKSKFVFGFITIFSFRYFYNSSFFLFLQRI